VVFLNGLPLGLHELRNAATEGVTLWSACSQLQTDKAETLSLVELTDRNDFLNRASGGVVFTTIETFMPEKSEPMQRTAASTALAARPRTRPVKSPKASPATCAMFCPTPPAHPATAASPAPVASATHSQQTSRRRRRRDYRDR
jgi:hypothetical protein